MNRSLFLIVLAELLGTSLWFTGNSAAADLAVAWGIHATDIGHITIAVQFGFIVGTALLALSGLADRWHASRIFAAAALAGAAANAGFALLSHSVSEAIVYRFLTGITLAGIYPLGMKLVVSWTPGKAGESLAWLVGALTVGKALPHFIRGLGANWQWQTVVLCSSALSVVAAFLILQLGDGPHLPAPSKLQVGASFRLFGRRDFRAATFSYFGHMWELYAMWTAAPLLAGHLLMAAGNSNPRAASLLASAVIGAGAVGCVIGGRLSHIWGSAHVATLALAGSALVCAVYPVSLSFSFPILTGLLLFWGFAVVADSPQFSALVARSCPAPLVGSALTIQNSLGFLITVFSIDLVTNEWSAIGPRIAWLLLPGPIFGMIAILPLLRETPESSSSYS